jgi:hypothetical protein
MRLVTDDSPGAYAVSVPCIICGTMHALHTSVMDLEGEAFRAYYCPAHVPINEPITHNKREN